ncbi:MAG: dihydroorotase [Halodesulfurarchaeum sp.]
MQVFRDAILPDGNRRDVGIADGQIVAVSDSISAEESTSVDDEIDARGKRLFPGMIDGHVHFREPGFPHKETWTTGSKAAAAGGVTTVVDQPNTDPPTIDGRTFDQKERLATDSIVDYGINGGVTLEWEPEELLSRPLFALGEIFLADSTGDMGIERDHFEEALREATETDTPVTVHAEDAEYFDESARSRDDAGAWSAYRTPEAEVAGVETALTVAADLGTQVHIAHASTPEGIDRAAAAGATTEVTPHHLFLSTDDIDSLGTFGRMNPPLRDEDCRLGVAERVSNGTVDMIATDHAPHTRAEKDASIWDAPSGVPGVETALPLLLAAARDGLLTYERVRDLTAATPASVFGLENKGTIAAGMDADLVLVDPDSTREIRGTHLHGKTDWTPFEGMVGVFPELTMVRGRVVWRADDPGRASGTFGDAVGRNVREADGIS